MTTSVPFLLNLLSATFGLIGTLLLYKGSYALEQFSEYMSEEQVQQRAAQNDKRIRIQRAGLALLTCSFALQFAAQFA